MLAGNLTIKTQLILAVTVPCLALLLVGAASLRSMDNIRQQAEELFQNTATPCGPWRKWPPASRACASAST